MTTENKGDSLDLDFLEGRLMFLEGRLMVPFVFPDDSKWEDAIEEAQDIYEFSKRTEEWAYTKHDRIASRKSDEWENAISRLIALDKAAGDAQDGKNWKAISRTAAEKLAEIEPGWKKYEAELLLAVEDKRIADKWHSIAYQRLETLRTLYKGKVS